jgi:hypothetical protein
MIIDFHTHCFPNKIAHDTINYLEQKGSIKAFTDGTRSSLEKSMVSAGIALSLNLPVATSAEQVTGINSWAGKNNKPPVLSVGAIHPLSENPEEIISVIGEKSLHGVKMHPEYQNFSPDDTALDPIWKACIGHSIFVIFHAGADMGFKKPFKSNPAKFATVPFNVMRFAFPRGCLPACLSQVADKQTHVQCFSIWHNILGAYYNTLPTKHLRSTFQSRRNPHET